MSRRAASAKASGEPPKFPATWPAWRKIACALCGAKPGDACIDLTASLAGSQQLTPKGARLKQRPTLKQPHQRRVADAQALKPE